MIAIGAVVLAMSSRTIGFFRQPATKDQSRPVKRPLSQEIRYCRTPDGHRIAWSSVGKGYPLIRSLGWFTNLEMEWDSPVSSAFCQKLANRFRLVRYDGRGMGLSDREVEVFDAETRLADFEAVVDASGLERFAILGMSEGGGTAIAYAAKYPDRVSHLIIWGSFLRAPSFKEVPQLGAVSRLVEKYWGTNNPAFHQAFTGTFLPDGNAAENKLFNDLQSQSATGDVAFRFMTSLGEIDIRELAPTVDTPALVLHRKGDLAIPVRYGREFAELLPNARLVLLDGNNHWFVTEDRGVDDVIRMIEEFVKE